MSSDVLDVPCIEQSDVERLCKHPLVSVLMVTYNHERYIRQAIDGVVMQETDFEYELIIGEDCSQDRTREICFEYQRLHPDKIRVLWSETNLFAINGNSRRVRARPRGKYIACCEGDDYWTDSKKLQKQVEYMEAHPECVMTFHHRWVAGADGVVPPENQTSGKAWKGVEGWPKLSREYLLTHSDMVPPTLTMMLRRRVLDTLPAWGKTQALGDRTVAVWAAGQGSVEFVGGIWPSVYRIHDGGVSSRSGIVSQAIRMCESDMAFYENLVLDFVTRQTMIRNLSTRAAKVRVARLGASQDLLDRFSRELFDFGKKHPEFRRAYRRAFIWRAWCDARFRRLAFHRWAHVSVEWLKSVLPYRGYGMLRRGWRVLRGTETKTPE